MIWLFELSYRIETIYWASFGITVGSLPQTNKTLGTAPIRLLAQIMGT